MGAYLEEWKSAKKAYEKEVGKKKPGKGFFNFFQRGTSIETAFKKYDDALTYPDKEKFCQAAFKAKSIYVKVLDGVAKEQGDKKIKTETIKLKNQLTSIYVSIENDKNAYEHPPVPSGRMVKAQLLRKFNLIEGYKPRNLDLEATTIEATIEVDSELEKLMKAGEAGVTLLDLGNVALEAARDYRKMFIDTIKQVDKTLLTKNGADRAKTIKEANEVLRHYANLVSTEINDRVEKRWKAALARRADLKSFRLRTVRKVALGSLAVGVSVASAVLSCGVLATNIIGTINGCKTIFAAIANHAKGIDKVHKDVESAIQYLLKEYNKNNTIRNAIREGASTVNPWMKSLNETDNKLQQLNGLISKIEVERDKLAAALDKIIADANELNHRETTMTPDQGKWVRAMRKEVTKTFDQVVKLHERVAGEITFVAMGRAVLAEAKAGHDRVVASSTAAQLGQAASAVFSALNLALKLAGVSPF